MPRLLGFWSAPQPMALEAISYLLLEKAREGKVIARLKWGDPFVFDRGGEEALFLHENGIPFEVVPGIPAGLAVPAYAGIPVTYPGGGDTITLVRGHEDESRSVPDIDWASLATLDGTVICYVGAQQLPRMLDAMATLPNPPKSVAIVTSKFPSAQFNAVGMRTETEKRGLKVPLYLEYEAGNRDFGAIAARVKEANADFLWVGSLGLGPYGLVIALLFVYLLLGAALTVKEVIRL